MKETEGKPTSLEAAKPGDIEAIHHLREAVIAGRNWYISLLEAMGLWTSTEEIYRGREYNYLVSGEAFDWLLLSERLCQAADGLLPENEKNDLVFHGRPPVVLGSSDVKEFIGASKYCQYLNYFYGITVEGMLLLAVQEEVNKERQALLQSREADISEEAYHRIYGAGKTDLLDNFREKCHIPKNRSMRLTELKEFTYWLFKYRIKYCEKARVASDTKKALAYLKRQWEKKGLFAALATDDPCVLRS